VDAPNIKEKYRDALDSFLAKAALDPYIVGVVLLGSLSYATVWERSDIDLYVITQEIKLRVPGYTLVENDINIHASIVTRAEFKRAAEGALGGSFMHSLFSRGTLVYSRDETLGELFAERHRMGARDREISILRSLTWLISSIDKAHKWLRAKDDPNYSFFWIMKCLDPFAQIDLIRNGEIPDREAVVHASRLNPTLFDPLYSGLINGPKDAATIGAAVDIIERYVLDDARELAAPIFNYLSEIGGVRSSSEIDSYFDKNFGISAAGALCEWLADRGLIDKVSSPVRLTEKSKVHFDEAAFYYDEAN